MEPNTINERKDFYQNKIKQLEAELSLVRKRRNLVSAGLIAIFILLAVSVYHYVTGDRTLPDLIVPFLSTIGFALLTRLDSRLLEKIDNRQALVHFNRQEADYLEGDCSGLDKGQNFTDPAHPYSNDLDLFGEESLFQAINRTVTPNGASRLAEMLLNPSTERTVIEDRQDATAELASRVDWYQKFLAGGNKRRITATNDQMIQQWKSQKSFFRTKAAKRLVYCSNGLLLLCLCTGIFETRFLGIALMIFILQALVALLHASKINRLNVRLGTFITAAGNYFFLARVIQEANFTSGQLSEIEKKLFSEKNALKAFAALNRIQNGFEGRANILVTVLLDGLFINDLHLVLRLEKWKNEYVDHLDGWIAAVNEMEALVSMANFRFNHPNYAVPEIGEDNLIDAVSMGHPLLPAGQLVTNNFRTGGLHQLYIVTGANMAGKSTFLRAVGVNLVLALSGNVVCAERFSFVPMHLFTSMRTTDNLSKGTSYFHAELLRLKSLTEHVSNDRPHFVILDEMLKGTNSKDKLYGSIRFLNKLLSLPVSGLIATHDLALGKLAEENPGHFSNICFEIEHTESDITYDYKLKQGVSQNMNASILMERMGLI